jgi:hypothetical protein
MLIPGFADSTERTAFCCHRLTVMPVNVGTMTDTISEGHINSVARIFSWLGETGSTQEIIVRLDQTHA